MVVFSRIINLFLNTDWYDFDMELASLQEESYFVNIEMFDIQLELNRMREEYFISQGWSLEMLNEDVKNFAMRRIY